MIRELIVPLDGSEHAERALLVATSLAVHLGIGIKLVCAHDASELAEPAEYLDAVTLAWGIHGPAPLVIHDRPAPAAILYAAESQPESMICMTTRGRGAVTTAVLGSVADHVVRHATTPVLILGPGVADDSWFPGPMIIGVDSEISPERTIAVVGEIADRLDVPTWLVQVLAPSASGTYDDSVEGGMLERASQQLVDAGVKVGWDVLHATDPSDALCGFAAEKQASVIAVTTRAKAGVAGLALGSVARQLLRDAPCPVLVLRTPFLT